MNFFDESYKESLRNDELFGLCDDQDGSKAYSDILDQSKWIATVVNEDNISIWFTAIDNSIIILKERTNDKESTCDGMLTFESGLFLVELKEKTGGGWITVARDQLENTIRLLLKEHDLSSFKYKKAYACNKKHPSFTVIDASERKSFFIRTKGFRLDVNTNIKIKKGTPK